VDKLIDIFMPRFYGAAATHILKFRKELDAARKANHGYITYFSGYSTFNYITNDMLRKFQKLFDEAEAAVKDDQNCLQHVQRARMGIDNLTVRRFTPIFYHGNNWKPDTQEFSIDDVAARFFRYYDASADRFTTARGLKNNIRAYHKSFFKKVVQVPPPQGFENRSFFDCYPAHFANESPAAIEIVPDDESPVGEAMRMDVAKSHHYNMPFAAGVYDQGHEKTLAEIKYNKIPDDIGYHWFKVPALLMPEDGYAFVSRAWTIQLPFVSPYISGRKFEVWVSAKHVGEQFHKGQGKPEFIYVDRILFVEAE
ncbi:MAG: hypothetical protein IJS15_04255, partial [Victivallales bacterium]|nr:hypothetical protein [Victivallales bacterium]